MDLNAPALATLHAELAAGEPKLSIRTSISGSDLTTFAVGGQLQLLIEPFDEPQLQSALKILTANKAPFHILGAGSNLLISSGGIPTPVIRLGKGFRIMRPHSGGIFYVGGSSALMTVARELSTQGFSGLEFAGGIPASIGGAVRMNAGAHGGELVELLQCIRVCTDEGKIETVTPQDFSFAYRTSGIPSGWVVLGAELRLVEGDRELIEGRRKSFLEERKKRQPLSSPCAGSVFRNPSPERTAGFLIERAGLKGSSCGGAQVSELHANWILNPQRSATDADVKSLIERCQNEVQKRFGERLIPEVVVWDA